MNSLFPTSSSHASKKIRSLSAVPILNYQSQLGVLPASCATFVLQLLSAYLITTNGSIFERESMSSLKMAEITRIFIGGFLIFLSTFFKEISSTPIFVLPSITSMDSLGRSGLFASNLSTPVPKSFSLKYASIRISGSLLLSKQISQLQRCLSAGMKQVLIVFSNLPTLILKTIVSSKLPALRHSLYIQFFFMLQFELSLQCFGQLNINNIQQFQKMKKKADFLEEMKNSQQFLNKLNNFKKASKEIKDKNKLISHRNIWVKEFKYLARLQRDQDLENASYFQLFDKYLGLEMEQRQIFGKDSYKSYSQYLKTNQQTLQLYQVNQWRSLSPLLHPQKESPPIQEMRKNLEKQQKMIQEQLSKLQNFQINQSKVKVNGINSDGEDEEGEFAFLQELLAQHNFDDVRGFDFQVNQLRRISEGETHLKEYIESLSDRLSEDEISSVINQYHHASNLLNQTLQLQLQKLGLDYEQALSLDNQLLTMSQNYQIINHIYSTYLGRGKSLALYTQRLGIQFPNINRKILDRMTEYIEAKLYKGRKSNAVKRNFLREKQELLQKVEKEVNDRIEAKIRKAHKEAERLQRKEEKIKLEKELELLRAEYQKRKQEKDRQIREEEEKQKQEERKRQAVRKLYLDELSKKAIEVHEIKQRKLKQEDEKRKAEIDKQQKKLRSQIQQNKPKVQQRHQAQSQKQQKKLQQQRSRKQHQQKNQQRINKAIQGYSFRPNIEASQQRLNAPTDAMIKRKEIQYDKADKIQLTKMTGYNIKQLMGDQRFKLNAMLFQAGLANTQYAREVLNRMSKRIG